MALSAALKARLERQYRDGEVPYADLVKSSGLTRFEFQALVKQEGWGPRPKPGGSVTSGEETAETAEPLAEKPKAASTRQKKATNLTIEIDLVQKIYRTLWSELKKLDKQEGSKSQDRERASRALSQLVTSMEKAVSMQKAIERNKTGDEKPKDREALANAEDLRRKIAERLERLHSQRLAAK